MRQHSNLGSGTGVTGAGLDLQQTLLDFRHFLAEQLDHEFGGRTRQHNRCAAQGQVHFHDHGAHTVTGTQVFLGDHLAAAQTAFDATALHNDVTLVHALDGADENLFAARHKVVEQHLTLSITDFLQNHLLGGHCANAPNGNRRHRLFDVLINFDVWNLFQRFKQQNFLVRQLQSGFIRDHMPAAEGLVAAAVAVQSHPDVYFTGVKLFSGLRQGRFHSAQHHITFHVLLTGNSFNQH